jgi:hypothetical protein
MCEAVSSCRGEAARLWISGLEAVNRKLGLSRVIDLSATRMRSFCLAGRSIGTKIGLRRSTRRRRVDVDNGPGSIERMGCRALVSGGRARGSDRFCRLVIS